MNKVLAFVELPFQSGGRADGQVDSCGRAEVETHDREEVQWQDLKDLVGKEIRGQR